jgi:putative transposase
MLGLIEDRRSATRQNEACAVDFVHDQLAIGRTPRVLTMIARSRGSRPQSILGSPSALLMLCRYSNSQIGSLNALRVDQGNEFASRDLDTLLNYDGAASPPSSEGRKTLPSGEPKMVYP